MVVKIVDRGFKRYKDSLVQLNSHKIVVGLFNVDDNILNKGIVNEFGTTQAGKNHNITIPERSFLRSTFNKNHKKVAKKFNDMVKLFSKTSVNVKQKMQSLGLEEEGEVRKTITNLRRPANAPSTIKQKGSSNPLIDTGEMRNRIASEVRKKL